MGGLKVMSPLGISMAAIVLTIAVAVGWMLWPWASMGRANPGDQRQVTLGEGVYTQYCASCHGANLEGQPGWRIRKPDGRLPAPPHDATGHTWHHPDEQLFQITKSGLRPPLAPDGYKSDMAAYAGVLSDDQIWAALAFIKSKWPAEIRARQSAIGNGGN